MGAYCVMEALVGYTRIKFRCLPNSSKACASILSVFSSMSLKLSVLLVMPSWDSSPFILFSCCSLDLNLEVVAVWRSMLRKPTRVNASANKELFTLTSNGESACIEGLRFTSRSQGFKFSSTNTSKPYNSKQLPCTVLSRVFFAMCGSTDKSVLTMRSMMRFHMISTSTPSCRRWRFKADNDHLWPILSSCTVWFSMKFVAFLLME
mmetsp:Transcript_45018/g.131073  ORF Transcript_45018/g.131073 Transcript_45018/m.131073 type:complete len:206 (-) Transcript_45018:722-1339(-)